MRVKMLTCGKCGNGYPSEAHHVRIGTSYKNHWATVPLCRPCHLHLHAHRKQHRQLEEQLIRDTLEKIYGAGQLPEMLVRAGR